MGELNFGACFRVFKVRIWAWFSVELFVIYALNCWFDGFFFFFFFFLSFSFFLFFSFFNCLFVLLSFEAQMSVG